MKVATTMVVLAIALSCVAALLVLRTPTSTQNFSDWSPPVNLGPNINTTFS